MSSSEERSLGLELYYDLDKHYTKVLRELCGDGYYNYGVDVKTCNKFACEDMLYKISGMRKLIRTLIACLSLSVVMLLGTLIWICAYM